MCDLWHALSDLQNRAKHFAKEWTSLGEVCFDGPVNSPAPAWPVWTGPVTSPVGLTTGCGIRLRAIVRRWKSAPGYTLAIGDDLGIVGSEINLDPDSAQPDLRVTLVAGHPQISASPQMFDAVEIEVNRGSGFTLLDITTGSPVVDTHPLPPAGQSWQGEVVCFRSTQLAATLVAYQAEPHEHPWLILTDLPPAVAQASWYQQRSWVEGGFKDIKRGGWQWHLTRMADPERAARLWLVLAVAQLYSVSLGSQLEADTPAPQPQALPATHIARRTAKGQPQPPRLSLATLGRLAHLSRLIWRECLSKILFKGPNSCPVMT